MQTFLGLFFCAIMLLIMLGLTLWKRLVVKHTYAEFAEKDYSYTLVRDKTDGTFTKAILNLGKKIDVFSEETIQPQLFLVSVFVENKEQQVQVKSAYPCDIDGNKTNLEGATHIALEFLPKFALQSLEKATCTFRHSAINEPITCANDIFEM